MITAFLKAYIFTLLIETTIINLLSNKSIWLNTLVSIGINTITLPFVWFVFPFLVYNKYVCTLISEVFAVLIEGIMLSLVLFRDIKGFRISLLANLLSFLIGSIITKN